MRATRILRRFAALALILSLASTALALDATQAVRRDITPKSPVPTGTVATWPMDAAVPPGWLACNGQAVPSSYPELRALMGSVPNYNSRQFLRGATSGAGSTVTDSTRSHAHVVPSHSHTVSGTASAHSVNVGSQSVTGTASGQYIDMHQETVAGPGYRGDGGHAFVDDVNVGSTGSSGDPSHAHSINLYKNYKRIYGHTETKTVASTLSGRTSGGTYSTSGGSITGVTNAVGQTTESTGGSETAPMHTLVKYIIKAD